MRSPVVRSTFDVVLWLLARGASAGMRLPAQKLQRLLYLAQAHFAAANEGRKLMPATFLATELGPLEPTVYHVFDGQPPKLKASAVKTEVVLFLDGLWSRYGQQSADDLLDLIKRDLAYRECLAEGERNVEIEIAAMADAYHYSPFRRAPVRTVTAQPPLSPAIKSTPGTVVAGTPSDPKRRRQLPEPT